MKCEKSGFTLIELMVVIALFALVVTLGMMQLSFLDGTIAHAEVDKLTVVCSYLQQKAITTDKDQVLVCDEQKNKYSDGRMNEALSSRISFGYLPNVLGSPGSPSRTITKAITFADSSIHFYPTGTISSGTLYLTDKNKNIMYALSNAVSQVSYLR